jgi:hypothetical protein
MNLLQFYEPLRGVWEKNLFCTKKPLQNIFQGAEKLFWGSFSFIKFINRAMQLFSHAGRLKFMNLMKFYEVGGFKRIYWSWEKDGRVYEAFMKFYEVRFMNSGPGEVEMEEFSMKYPLLLLLLSLCLAACAPDPRNAASGSIRYLSDSSVI